MEAFASSLSWGLLLDALSVRHDRQPERLTLCEPPKGPPPELPRQQIRACSSLNQAASHAEGSPATVVPRRASHTVLFSSLDRFSEAEHTESPESGYGSGCRSATSLGSSATGRPLSSRSASVFLFPDADGQPTLEMSTLDEALEAEPQAPVYLEDLDDVSVCWDCMVANPVLYFGGAITWQAKIHVFDSSDMSLLTEASTRHSSA